MTTKTTQEMEQQVETLLGEGRQEEALKLAFEIVVASAKAKDFEKANVWHKKLMEIDPMALTEIVNSAEIIEVEQTSGMEDSNKDLWDDLYHTLSKEQVNALYYKTKPLELDPGKPIFQQGKLNDKLFFIDRGELKLIFTQGDKEIYLKGLGPGDIAGQETFFPISICTTTALTESPVEVRYIERVAMHEIEKDQPGFESKLNEYCEKANPENPEDILKEKGVERRQLERFKISGRTTTQIMDKKDNPVGNPFHGNIDDLSVSGASYFIKCSQKDTARTLLGRKASVSIELEGGNEIKTKGHIVGVHYHLFNDYSIHFRFMNRFDEESLNRLIPEQNME